MEQNLISWNLANFVTFTLMILVIWVVLGGAGHLLFGATGKGKTQTAITPGGVKTATAG